MLNVLTALLITMFLITLFTSTLMYQFSNDKYHYLLKFNKRVYRIRFYTLINLSMIIGGSILGLILVLVYSLIK